MEQKWPNELDIMRHGLSARNVKKALAKKAGVTTDYTDGVRDQDTPLTPTGMLQCEAVGRARADQERKGLVQRYDALLVSPYLRTRQSAERLCYGLTYTPKIVIEERIREIEFGIFDGLTPDGMKAKYPEEVARRKREGKYWFRPMGGESRPDVRLRVHSILDTITRDYAGKTIGIICHSVVVLAFRSLLERWGEEQYLIVDNEDDVKNASITRYLFDRELNKLLLAEYNRVYWTDED